MTAGLLFLLFTAFEWAGILLALRGLWLGLAWLTQPSRARDGLFLRASVALLGFGGLLLVVGAGLPHDLGRPGPERFWLPIVWPVMPFPSWFMVVSAVMVAIRGAQAMSALNEETARASTIRALAWVVFGVANLFWFRSMGVTVELLRGALPIAPSAVVGVLVLFVTSVVLTRALARRFNNRGIGPTVATFLALVVGSAVFCLPLVWMLLTSFKERADNTGSGLVWVPKVTKQHSFRDEAAPLVSTIWQGRKVWATIIEEKPQGVLVLEVERPFPLRGWRFEARQGSVTPESRTGIVIAADYSGQRIEGFVRKELAGGEREVEILKPSELAGTVYRAPASSTEPVRKVGVRWENYSEALEWLPPETLSGLLYVRNTLWLVFASVVGTLFSCSLVAYGFSRLRFPGRGALFGLMIATMMLPAAVTMLPRFLIWRGIGAIDTLIPVWLPTFTASAFNVFLLREFFKTVPAELEDAAKIDGCSPFKTYWKVMLPQIKPALTVIGIWTFMGAWNDFMSPLIYVSSPEKMPLSYAIQLFSADRGGEFGLMMAFATMSTIPVLIVFLLGQRYFVEGVQLSGLGGK